MSKGAPHIVPKNGGDDTAILLKNAVSLLLEMGVFSPDRLSPVVNFKHPAELEKLLDLSLARTGRDESSLENDLRDVIHYSVKTNHAFYHNLLYGGTDPYGLVGALISEALNTNQITFEIAPVFILIEMAIINHCLQLFGYENGDGLFAPGGSVSNMYGMMLARHRLVPEVKQKGISSVKPLVVFTSQDAHYSISKGVNWLGIGTDNLIEVPCDEGGRMIPDELDKYIQAAVVYGKLPMMVCATSGTTVLGAFDPLDDIAEVCSKYGVWLHVDACWGGTLIFSKKYKKPLSGIHRADSIAWNPSKMLGTPLQCSIFITKHKGSLHQCNCAAASYLFQPDKFYDVNYDTGDKSLQCGRKVDGFKLWYMWRARGEEGFEKLVDRAVENADYLHNMLLSREGFRLVIRKYEFTNICFWFIPKRLRGLEETEEWWNEVSKIAPKIKEQLTFDGSLLIGYQPVTHRNQKNFFRMVVTCNPEQTVADMDRVVSLIEQAGEGL